MPVSSVSICSNALLMLGAKPINSLEDASDRATIAANLWPSVRDSMLRAHPWNCAVKRAALAPDAQAPEFDWTYAFTLPDDFLRALSCGTAEESSDYRIESGKLLSNDNPCYLRYIWRNENPASWDSQLIHVTELAMCAVMAYPITQSASLAELKEKLFLAALKKAKSVDGQEDPPEDFGDSPLLRARLGMGYNYRNRLTGSP